MNRAGKGVHVLLRVLGVFLSWGAVSNHAIAYRESTYGNEIKLSYGTPVLLRFTSTITSALAKVGQVVNLEVEEPVYNESGVLAVAEGTPAKAQIINCRARTYAGEGGDLVIANFYLSLPNSQRIKLNGVYRVEGKDRQESLALGYFCLFGYLIKGKKALIAEGQTYRTVLAEDVIIHK